MSDSLGARLRRRREEQGIALVTIANETKIKVSLLEALERDDVTHWPSGIFRRAFIRAYAEAIGLNPDAIVREFLETYPDPEEVIAAAIAQAAERAEANAAAGRLRSMMGSALESLSRLRRGPAAPDLASGPVTPAGAAARTSDLGPRTSDDGLRTSDLGVRTSDDGLRTSDVGPRASDLGVRTSDDGLRASDLGLRSSDDRVRATAPAEMAMTADSERQEPSPPAPAPEPPLGASASPPPAPDTPRPTLDFPAVARLCTAFARVDSPEEAQSVLEAVARILDAAGVIVWMHDDIADELRPALSHGYSQRVLAQLPPVRVHDDNVTAAAFRMRHPCAVNSGPGTTGALAVPLPTPAGCGGVLALELENGGEQSPTVRDAATIVAALLGQLAGGRRPRQVEVEAPPVAVAAMPIPFRVMARR